MTQINEFSCDCCGEIQRLPDTWSTNFLTLFGQGLDKPHHLCIECARSVKEFIKEKKKVIESQKNDINNKDREIKYPEEIIVSEPELDWRHYLLKDMAKKRNNKKKMKKKDGNKPNRKTKKDKKL